MPIFSSFLTSPRQRKKLLDGVTAVRTPGKDGYGGTFSHTFCPRLQRSSVPWTPPNCSFIAHPAFGGEASAGHHSTTTARRGQQ